MGAVLKRVTKRVKQHDVFVLPAGSKPQKIPAVKNGIYRLLKWQREALQEVWLATLAIIVAPMGSGKSTLLRAFGWLFLQEGYKVVVAVPQGLIARSFKWIKILLPDGRLAKWAPELFLIDERGAIDQIVGFALRKASPHLEGRILVCTHQALVLAHKVLVERNPGRVSPWKGTALLLDETHHSKFHEDEEDDTTNRLGALVKHWVEKKAGPIRLATATWMRADDMTIVPPEERKKFVRYVLPFDVYLERMQHLREVVFRYVVGPVEDSLEYLFNESSSRTIVHIPAVASGLVRGSGRTKLEVLRSYESLVGPLVKAPNKHLRAYRSGKRMTTGIDLVDPSGRDARKDHLMECIDSGRGLPDITWALNMGKEGHDDPSLVRGIVVGARTSLPMIIQMLGRVIRDFPGKRRAEFNVVLPFDGSEDPLQLRNYLKIMMASMVVEWQFTPITIKCSRKARSAINRLRSDSGAMASLIEDVTDLSIMNDGAGSTEDIIRDAVGDGYDLDDEEKDAVVRHIASLFSSKSRAMMSSADDINFDPNLSMHAFECIRVYATSFDYTTLAEVRRAAGRKPPLTEEQVLRWADAHKAATGSWPTTRSGKVLGTVQ